MSHILVTGGGGFLGVALAEALARQGDRVSAIDTVITAPLAALASRFPAVKPIVCDIGEWASLTALLAADPPDAILHAAAVVGVAASVHAPFKTMRVNIEGSMTLFEAMRLHGITRMIHISSEETYGDFNAPSITEDHPQNPVMTYGISKLAVEHLGRTYRSLYGIEVINLRTCWVYGPGLPRSRVPKNFIDAALAGRPFHLASGADMAVDHTYIDDFVTGALAALDKADHPFDAYHLASGKTASVREIVAIISELVPGSQLSVGDGPYNHDAGIAVPAVRKGALDVTRAREVLGYVPQFDIRRGLAANVEFLRAAQGKDAVT